MALGLDSISAGVLERTQKFVRENPRARRAAKAAIREFASFVGQRHYEAARRTHRTENWITSSSSANGLIGASLSVLRDRSSEMQRNNPYAHRYPWVMANNIIGENLQPYAKLDGDKDGEKQLNRIWASQAPVLNADGTRLGAQSMFWQGCFAMIERGECFATRVPAFSSDGLPVPVQVRLSESDLVDHTYTQSLSGGGYVTNGLEYDARGRLSAYHFWKHHPGNSGLLGLSHYGERVRVPASDVAHLYVPTRPGQTRGVPWMSAAMIALRDLDDYRDAERVRKRIEATLTAFVIGGESDPDQGGAIGDVATDAQGKLIETFEPGLIAYLRGDKRIEMNKPTGVGGYSEYITTEMHAIATAMLIPYVMLTSDLTKVNYSSIRAGMLEFYRLIKVIRKLFYLPMFAQPMWDWVFEAAYLTGQSPAARIPCTWSAYKFESIDPVKEAQADLLCLQAGTHSLFQIIAEKGRDPYEVIAEMAKVNEELAAKDIKLSWQMTTNTPTADDPTHPDDEDSEE